MSTIVVERLWHMLVTIVCISPMARLIAPDNWLEVWFALFAFIFGVSSLLRSILYEVMEAKSKDSTP